MRVECYREQEIIIAGKKGLWQASCYSYGRRGSCGVNCFLSLSAVCDGFTNRTDLQLESQNGRPGYGLTLTFEAIQSTHQTVCIFKL